MAMEPIEYEDLILEVQEQNNRAENLLGRTWVSDNTGDMFYQWGIKYISELMPTERPDFVKHLKSLIQEEVDIRAASLRTSPKPHIALAV